MLIMAAVLIVLAAFGFVFASQRARKLEKVLQNRAVFYDANCARPVTLHSRPHYYGWWTALLIFFPALIFFVVCNGIGSIYLERQASQETMAFSQGADDNLHVNMATIESLRKKLKFYKVTNEPETYQNVQTELTRLGHRVPLQGKDYMVKIARSWQQGLSQLRWFTWAGAIIIAIFCGLLGLRQVGKRARNKVESVVVGALIAASSLAILTTIGIVLSMLFQTISFFEAVPLSNFFLGTVWDPRFAGAGAGASAGQFGLLPLLAGTLYIAAVAMLFAVPVGLFAAIYMAEYASPRVRSLVKPLLEVLAGIPTIVYGFFALTTVGPFLRDISASIAGGRGFIMAQSVLTAGLVMGIMLIPFVSSLSDDIITAVPRSLKEGSYGLGATRSETMKKVILPAALPGIVGALLLTASRAIGETMIVVLAAGVAANLTLNPFEAMTTMTVKIVNQLTGDLEFNSPQTLVAFALGMTLFFLTLLMNIFALYIVRKYREQYE